MHVGAFVPQGWRLDLVDVPEGRPQYEAMRDVALRLEQSGYDSLWLYDHFHTVPEARTEATFELWTGCTALALETKSIRIGQMVGCNMYRHPTLIAKMASCLDVISNGRFNFGLGAGWYEHEFTAYGFPFESAGTRLAKLDEALEIIIGLWTQDRFQFEGKHYKVGVGHTHDYHREPLVSDGAINHPKPVQKPHPPVWIGGGGEKKTLRTVAKFASYSNYGNDVASVNAKNEILDRHCENIGRDPDEIIRSVSLNVMVGPEQCLVEHFERLNFSKHDIEWQRNAALTGEPATIAERIIALRDQARVGYVLIYFPDAARGDSIERFAGEVMPHLR